MPTVKMEELNTCCCRNSMLLHMKVSNTQEVFPWAFTVAVPLKITKRMKKYQSIYHRVPYFTKSFF